MVNKYLFLLVFLILFLTFFLVYGNQQKIFREYSSIKSGYLELIEAGIDNRKELSGMLLASEERLVRNLGTITALFEEYSQEITCLISLNKSLEQNTAVGLGSLERGLTDLRSELVDIKLTADPMVSGSGSRAQEDYKASLSLTAGEDAFRVADYRTAAVNFERVLKFEPENTTARSLFAAALYRQNPGDSSQYQQIRNSLISVLAEDPVNKLALETLCMVSVESGNKKEAAVYFDRLFSLDSNAVMENEQLAAYLLQFGQAAAGENQER